MSEQRRLAAIVSADVAGYSRLIGRDESMRGRGQGALPRKTGIAVIGDLNHGILCEHDQIMIDRACASAQMRASLAGNFFVT